MFTHILDIFNSVKANGIVAFFVAKEAIIRRALY